MWPITYKTPRIKKEFKDDRLNTAVAAAAIYTAWLIFKFTNKKARITNVFRTREEQEKICRDRDVKFYNSVHQFWRGLDISSRGIDKDTIEGIERRVNLAFPYEGTAGKVTAKHHKVGKGVLHIHLQVGYNEPNYRPKTSA